MKNYLWLISGVVWLGASMNTAAASNDLSAGSVQGAPGANVVVPINLTAGTIAPASIQFQFAIPSGATYVSAAAGPAANAAGKSVTCNPISASALNCLIFGFNTTSIGSGDVEDITLSLGSSMSSGSYPLALSQLVMSDPNGQSITPITTTDGTLTVSGGTPQLTLTKHSDKVTTHSGDTLTFTIDYQNTGSDNALNSVIQDNVPAGTTVVSMSSGGTLNTGVVSWTLGTVAAGGSGSVSFQVQVQ